MANARRTRSRTARASWRWNRHEQHAPMSDAARAKAQQLPRLGAQANAQPSALMTQPVNAEAK